MLSVLKRSFSTATDKIATVGRPNIRQTVRVDYLAYSPKETIAMNAPILMYHGKFTSKHLWTPVADPIANATKRQVLSVDLRNHGGSERTTIDGSHVSLMALDMKQFMHEHNISKGVLVGHGIGGRAMMQMALNYPKMVEKLIVVDMGFNVPAKPLSFLYLLEPFLLQFIKKVDPEVKLEEAKDQLKKTLFLKLKDPFAIEILTNTLEKVNGKFQYSFNAEVMYESLWKGTLTNLDVTNAYEGQTLFLYGKSGFVIEEDFPAIRTAFPNVKLTNINTGNYGMVENPSLFSEVVSDFVNSS